jgi:hypothetical protein
MLTLFSSSDECERVARKVMNVEMRGTYIQNIHTHYTRTHASEDKNRNKNSAA